MLRHSRNRIWLERAKTARPFPNPFLIGRALRFGRQSGIVSLKDRKVHVDRPRLRKRGGGPGAEVEVPAYEAIKADGSLGEQVLKAMMRGVSTRHYKEILVDACDAVGVSKSSVFRYKDLWMLASALAGVLHHGETGCLVR